MSFSSVNVLQEVPYTINQPVLDTLEYLYREHLDDNNCLLWHKYNMLHYELDFSTITREEKGTKAHQEAVRVIREREELNIATQSKRRSIADSISVAKRYSHNPEIFFPHNVDYRCRIYPYTTGISTQGADYQKSLLKYSQGVPIGDGCGPYWLAVHVANTYGNDKLPFEDRVQWVVDNEDFIRRVASEPLETVNEWADVDSPLCFLAACMEWLGYLEEGSEFVTTLPIAMDGTCNGLQHYAALLGDRQLAELVNVAASDTPSRDIYTVVADNVKRRMLKYIEDEGGDSNSRYAPACDFMLSNGLVNRKLCKPPTMTLVYGVTYRGILEQCQKYIIQEMIDNGLTKPDTCESLLGICETAAAIIYKALDEELGKAVKAMNFIKAATRALNKKGKTLKWEVPVTEFNVINSLEKRKRKVVEIYNSGKKEVYRIWTGTNRPDNNRQVNASSPNFIHSLDAAHLIITIDKLRQAGITQVTAIHDSYAVPAPYVDTLHRCIREAFAELHSYSIWEDFKRNVRETLDDEKLWKKLMKDFKDGEDLTVGDFVASEEVFDSDYFFS
jgi:DNA-directed RNA polymerase